MADKLSFRKGKRLTGLARIASPYPPTYILLGGQMIGQIYPPRAQSNEYIWSIGMIVKSDEHPGWKWVRFKKTFEKEPEAREWFSAAFAQIAEKNQIHRLEASYKPWQS